MKNYRLVGWLISQLAFGQLAGWLNSSFTGWQGGAMFGCRGDWLIGQSLVNLSVGSLVGWGDMVTTIGGSDSIKYDNSSLLSLLLPLQPGATETPLLSLSLLDRKNSTSNTTVVGEITRIIEHAANTTSQVETMMDTAINAGGATTNPLPPDSNNLQKLNITSTTKICPSNTNTQTLSTKLTATAMCSH
jgi:hypothetical protein